jgi:hypothetical protein
MAEDLDLQIVLNSTLDLDNQVVFIAQAPALIDSLAFGESRMISVVNVWSLRLGVYACSTNRSIVYDAFSFLIINWSSQVDPINDPGYAPLPARSRQDAY